MHKYPFQLITLNKKKQENKSVKGYDDVKRSKTEEAVLIRWNITRGIVVHGCMRQRKKKLKRLRQGNYCKELKLNLTR